MEFKNKGNDMKVRLEKDDQGYRWITVRKNTTVDIPKEVGILYGFEEVKSKPEVKVIPKVKVIKKRKFKKK